jgi:hypothetical protein
MGAVLSVSLPLRGLVRIDVTNAMMVPASRSFHSSATVARLLVSIEMSCTGSFVIS